MGAEPGLAEDSSPFTRTGGWVHVDLDASRHQSLSDRDPNSVQTLSAFDESVDWVKAGTFTQQDIDEAKLSVFSAVDAPVAPADKGAAIFVCPLFIGPKFTRRWKTHQQRPSCVCVCCRNEPLPEWSHG